MSAISLRERLAVHLSGASSPDHDPGHRHAHLALARDAFGKLAADLDGLRMLLEARKAEAARTAGHLPLEGWTP